MSNYNLTDNVQDSFTFDIDGKRYSFRYPTTAEIEEAQTLSTKIEEAQKEEREDELKEATKRLEGFIYAFISPEGHDMPVQEALKSENIRVMRNFNRMVKTELSIQ